MTRRILDIEYLPHGGAYVRGIKAHVSLHKRMQIMAYALGHTPPRYPVPAVWDVYPDAEYLLMLYQRALLEQHLRDMRGEKQQ